jgi:hypothetical protein
MWVATPFGWLSIVQARLNQGRGAVDPNTVQVRARVRSHLERLKVFFPAGCANTPVIETMHADYRFRIIVPKKRILLASHFRKSVFVYGYI